MWALVGDIGGTNMRFAAIRDGAVALRETYPTDSGQTFAEAVSAFSARVGSRPERAVVAAAGPVQDGVVHLTNNNLVISEHVLAALTLSGHARVLNDFAAAAWAMVTIRAGELETLHGPAEFPDAARLVIGPGTGLGVAGLVWHEGRPVVVPGEGGHVRIAPNSDRQFEIFGAYARMFPEFAIDGGPALEAEAVLSGTGIPNLYAAISGRRETPKGAEIFSAARDGSDPVAVETVSLFAQGLGAVAGDLALVFNARGGVFICGGVAAKNRWLFDLPEFLTAFVEGGRFTALRRSYPIHLVGTGEFGIEGGRNYLTFTG